MAATITPEARQRRGHNGRLGCGCPQPPVPACPLSITYPPLGEADHSSTIGIDAVAEVEVLYPMLARYDGSNDVLVLNDGGNGAIVLDLAQHVRYTGCVHKTSPYGPGSGVLLAPPGPSFCDTCIVSRYGLDVKILLVYYQRMGKSISINGKRLRELRVEQALSLRALGERSGVAYDTINKLELGRRPAHASTIRKLADALGVEPKELMKGE
jgi:DNA-binding Xre family transcriptional regulator